MHGKQKYFIKHTAPGLINSIKSWSNGGEGIQRPQRIFRQKTPISDPDGQHNVQNG